MLSKYYILAVSMKEKAPQPLPASWIIPCLTSYFCQINLLLHKNKHLSLVSVYFILTVKKILSIIQDVILQWFIDYYFDESSA